ncbi:MAG: hypothetical protein WD206_00610 [Actinomycetota bacterium]
MDITTSVRSSSWVRLAHAGGADEIAATAFVLVALWAGWVAWSRLFGSGFRRLPRPGAWIVLGAAVVLLASAVFVPTAIWGPTPLSGPRPASPARLAIASPVAGAIVTGPEVDVRIDLRDGSVVDATTTEVRPDEGHIHLMLDGALIDMTYDGAPVQLDDLAPGEHRLEAEFVAADHAPFSPRVRSSTEFVVDDAASRGQA